MSYKPILQAAGRKAVHRELTFGVQTPTRPGGVAIRVPEDESGAEGRACLSPDKIQFSQFFSYHYCDDQHFHGCVIVLTLRSEGNRN